MWILTIVLLLANGDIKVVTTEAGHALSPASCQTRAQNVWKLNDIGFHVLDVNCSRQTIT